jgi:hypothetical protein
MSPRRRDQIERDTARHSQPVVCSFCNKPGADVQKMIAGPNGFAICNECVDACNDILADRESTRQSPPDTPEDLGTQEMLSFKCSGCGRNMSIDITPRTAREPDSD